MKKNNLKSIVIFTIVLTFIACDKNLELSPPTVLSDPSFWKVPADFEKAANAFYFTLGGNGVGTLDANSDITVGSSSNNVSSGNIITPQSSAFWEGSYSTIRGTNKLLENYETATDIKSEIIRYAAEARFFRARTYFNLIISYGDVPLITRVLEIDSEELYAPRTPRAEVVNFILEDLDFAAANLPVESAISNTEKGRVSKGAVLSFKARVGLYEGTLTKYHSTGANSLHYLDLAISAAEQVIASREYELFTDFGTDQSYRYLFIDEGEGSSESILARRYDEPQGIFHNATRWIKTGLSNPTKVLADMYVATDGLPIEKSPLFQGYDTMISEFENRDPRMAQTIIVPGTVFNYLGADEIILP